MPRSMPLVVLPLLAGAAFAQEAPAPKPAAAKAVPQARYPGVSPAGNAILTKLLQQGDPLLRQLILQLRDNGQATQLALQRPALDVDVLAGLLKKSDGLQAQIRGRQTDRVIAAIRALPEADRAPFLKAIGGRPAAAAPTVPVPPAR